MKLRRVYLIGAGPGDPSFITVKWLRYLGIVDVVVYDHLGWGVSDLDKTAIW